MLLRKHIGRRLADYYAQPSNAVVGSASGPGVEFSSLLGEWHWNQTYRKMYNEQEGQWLTPVELFRPVYSEILANFVVRVCDGGVKDLHLVELGGGRGTNANILLTHLQMQNPQLYDRTTYTVFDSSPSLFDLQRAYFESGEHAHKIDCVLLDLMDVAERKIPFLSKSDTPTVVIALELLDNLPHDKVRRCKTTRMLQQAELRNVDGMVESSSDDMKASAHLEEVFVPLSDPLLSKILENVPLYSGSSGGRPSWVPSVACGVLQRLAEARPHSKILLADFDWLPPPDISSSLECRRSILSEGEPLITAMDGTDYECYIESPNCCDILFPTNFDKLTSFCKKNFGDNASVQVMKQGVFLQTYGRRQVQATRSWLTGFTPLVSDFGNCSVLTMTRHKDDGVSSE